LVDLAWLLSEELAVQRRIIRVVGDHLGFSLDFEHVQEVLRFAAEEQRTGKELSLPSGWTLRYGEDALEFVAAQTGKQQISKDYELVLTVPGEVTIPQIGSKIEAVRLDSGAVRAHEDQESLFNLDLLSKELIVRNWRAGDRFWPAHTKGPRKIKQMLQDAHVPQRSRSGWPVVVSGTEIVWVRGFPGRAQMRPAEDNAAVLIRELPLGEQGKHAAETAS
jgi:tRNA(Ile)-lysidine synthase